MLTVKLTIQTDWQQGLKYNSFTAGDEETGRKKAERSRDGLQ